MNVKFCCVKIFQLISKSSGGIVDIHRRFINDLVAQSEGDLYIIIAIILL